MNSNGGVETAESATPAMSPTKAALAEAVRQQGDVVRKLKEEKADKSKVGKGERGIFTSTLLYCNLNVGVLKVSIHEV